MFEKNQTFSSFSVDDLDRAKDFYSGTLGLKVSDNGMGLKLHLATGGLVFIYPKSDHVPATFTILNFPVDDIDRTVERLTDAGVRMEVYDEGQLKTDARGVMTSHGQRIAWFKDPAGNFLSVIEEGDGR